MFFIEYRDPIFGIIIFLLLIAIVSFSSYWWGIFKSKNETQKIKNFIQSFEHIKNKEEYAKLLKDFPISLETMTLLAINYTKSGDFDKAIAIYLNAMEQVKAKEQKIYVFTLLGKTYFLAGFLQRSKNIFLDAIKLQPRNIEALRFLVAIFEKLHEFDSALEAIEALSEMGEDVAEQKILIESKRVISSKSKSSSEDVLNSLYKNSSSLIAQRFYIEFAIREKLVLRYEDIKNFDFEKLMDLLWYQGKETFPKELLENNNFVKELYSAKNECDEAKSSSVFELDILIKLKGKKDDIDLNFEYVCSECKSSYAVHFNRCPKCMHCGISQIEPILAQRDLQNYKFLV